MTLTLLHVQDSKFGFNFHQEFCLAVGSQIFCFLIHKILIVSLFKMHADYYTLHFMLDNS